jgi:hypothetical protein
MKMTAGLLMACLCAALPVAAIDRWEIRSDDNAGTNNELQNGSVQVGHDLQTEGRVTDVDWYRVVTQAERSYEVRVSGGGVVWKYPACPHCATIDRVAQDGTVTTAGDADLSASGSQSVRWIGGGGVEHLRVLPNADGVGGFADELYDVALFDTTLYLPRFNNAGSQRTVLILQSTRQRTVEGRIFFHDGTGNQLLAHDFAVPAYGSVILDTSSLPALAGRSGSAVIAHTGGAGAFTGKGVSLEPATGFTFDTAVTTAPR